MKNSWANINWFSVNLSLKLLSVGTFLAVIAAAVFPRLRDFMLGLALVWSGILAIQVFGLKPLEEVDRDHDLVTRLNLRS